MPYLLHEVGGVSLISVLDTTVKDFAKSKGRQGEFDVSLVVIMF